MSLNHKHKPNKKMKNSIIVNSVPSLRSFFKLHNENYISAIGVKWNEFDENQIEIHYTSPEALFIFGLKLGEHKERFKNTMADLGKF